MATQILKQTHTLTTLLPSGTPALALTTPPSQTSDLSVALSGIGKNDVGVWECTPGKFERQNVYAEVMHILSGSGTFTPTDDAPMAFAAGDTVFFSDNTTGVWDIKETVRKVYVIFSDV